MRRLRRPTRAADRLTPPALALASFAGNLDERPRRDLRPCPADQIEMDDHLVTTSSSTSPDRLGPVVWLRSFPRAARLLLDRDIRLRRDRLGDLMSMRDGRTYVPFRETISLTPRPASATPTVLQPRFRLRGLGRPDSLRHRLFRRICIVTTPFFVGVDGFRSKLWMYDPATGDYAGLYDWDDPASAQAYAEGLSAVLRTISVSGSVSYELTPGEDVATYLATVSASRASAKAG
jgi:hypothetical protein